MKKKIFIILFGCILFASVASAQCVTYKTKRGDSCGNEKSIDVTFTNNCSDILDIYHCMQRPDRSWSCSLSTDIKPGKKAQIWMCESTGRVFYDTRQAGTNDQFRKP